MKPAPNRGFERCIHGSAGAAVQQLQAATRQKSCCFPLATYLEVSLVRSLILGDRALVLAERLLEQRQRLCHVAEVVA
jgi:hypothetical protein